MQGNKCTIYPSPCLDLPFGIAVHHVGVFGYGTVVGDAAGGGTTAVACARARSVSGLRTTFSNVNRFRAEMGGQFRIKTESSTRSST